MMMKKVRKSTNRGIQCSLHSSAIYQNQKCLNVVMINLVILTPVHALLKTKAHRDLCYFNYYKTALSCSQKCVWDSQSLIRKIPAGKIRLSAAILYSGAIPTKVIRVLTFLKSETISTLNAHVIKQSHTKVSTFTPEYRYQVSHSYRILVMSYALLKLGTALEVCVSVHYTWCRCIRFKRRRRCAGSQKRRHRQLQQVLVLF